MGLRDTVIAVWPPRSAAAGFVGLRVEDSKRLFSTAALIRTRSIAALMAGELHPA